MAAPARRFRPDVEGMRAIAVVAVVLYHARPAAVTGGYVGVDVFFVLSGFLITGLLWRELQSTGTLALGSFYGRRARRLLPASALVIVVTLIAAARWAPPLEVHSVAKDAAASALYVGNYRFALQQTNYLNATAPPSPLQHYWSLGVEEQFYLVWPFLIIGLWALARRLRRGGWTVVAGGLAGVGIVSFAASLYLTKASQPWAFFSLPTRAWELAAGGLVALALPALRRMPAVVAAAVGWAGLAAVLVAVFRLTASTAFPGTAALLPVLGTAAVIAGGTSRPAAGPERLLRQRVFQVGGKISYSWYLWHFPALVLAPDVVGHPLAGWESLIVAAGSAVAAATTVVLVENPLRFSRWIASVPARSLAVGLSLSVAAALVAVAIPSTLPSVAGHGRRTVAALPAVSLDPALVRAVGQGVTENQVPANLDPTLAQVSRSLAPPFVDGCLDSFTDSSVHSCSFGDTASATTVLLYGDSHAAMWFPALEAVANARGWRLVVDTKASCPPVDVATFSPELGRTYGECSTFRQNVLAQIQTLHPALVVVGVARHYNTLYHFTVYGPSWLQGWSETVSNIRRAGSKVLVLGPVPKPGTNIPDCLSAHLNDAVQCTQPIQPSIFNGSGMAAERTAVSRAGGTYADVEPWFCTPTVCAVMVGNLLVWRDDNHITTSYAAWLEPAMAREVVAAAG